MKLVVMYRPNSEYGRIVEEFIGEFQHRHEDTKLDVVDSDSREGVTLMELYDIMQQPVILALRNDGSVLKLWEGPDLPLMDEVISYVLNA